ncbi:flagellar hook-length control protein FliK [Heliobacterium chlorum]|uniref:Flagellar hook-length control protein FliK n=1 Tax=Heliobacterium chlorum TaxID=2698 RepID=A0ABR7SY13_HELCL|nr:flagellar hook-length control protein FliK [Heliobacterium chlorum]MBC9783418.1 flagellar hook-length control protein FliK [Heliobacterium chlorum]
MADISSIEVTRSILSNASAESTAKGTSTASGKVFGSFLQDIMPSITDGRYGTLQNAKYDPVRAFEASSYSNRYQLNKYIQLHSNSNTKPNVSSHRSESSATDPQRQLKQAQSTKSQSSNQQKNHVQKVSAEEIAQDQKDAAEETRQDRSNEVDRAETESKEKTNSESRDVAVSDEQDASQPEKTKEGSSDSSIPSELLALLNKLPDDVKKSALTQDSVNPVDSTAQTTTSVTTAGEQGKQAAQIEVISQGQQLIPRTDADEATLMKQGSVPSQTGSTTDLNLAASKEAQRDSSDNQVVVIDNRVNVSPNQLSLIAQLRKTATDDAKSSEAMPRDMQLTVDGQQTNQSQGSQLSGVTAVVTGNGQQAGSFSGGQKQSDLFHEMTQNGAIAGKEDPFSRQPDGQGVSSRTTNDFSAFIKAAGKEDVKASRQEVFRQMVENTQLLKKSGGSELKIQLKPEVLGKMQLSLSIDSGIVSVRFSAENPQVRQMLESNLPELKHSLEEQGLKFDRIEVSVGNQNLNSQQQGGSSNPSSWSQENEYGRPYSSNTGTVEAEVELGQESKQNLIGRYNQDDTTVEFLA